jgi:hypothetical protein
MGATSAFQGASAAASYDGQYRVYATLLSPDEHTIVAQLALYAGCATNAYPRSAWIEYYLVIGHITAEIIYYPGQYLATRTRLNKW